MTSWLFGDFVHLIELKNLTESLAIFSLLGQL